MFSINLYIFKIFSIVSEEDLSYILGDLLKKLNKFCTYANMHLISLEKNIIMESLKNKYVSILIMRKENLKTEKRNCFQLLLILISSI